MKPMLFLVALALALSGCVSQRKPDLAMAQVAPGKPMRDRVAGPDGMMIDRVPFQIGASSATVEKMARQQACTGGPGAGLVTERGPVEVYRMQCDNGKVFMARCQLRQCKPM